MIPAFSTFQPCRSPTGAPSRATTDREATAATLALLERVDDEMPPDSRAVAVVGLQTGAAILAPE
jgi:hypothetical protein